MSDINGYQILTQIYESVNSIVYRGIRELDNLPVILKRLKQDYPTPAELTHYKQEYEITCNLNLEGVVKAYSLEEYQRTLIIILEDFGGNSLSKLMSDAVLVPAKVGGAGVQIPEFLHIASQTAEILGKIHAANVIHKDINPANIVLHPESRQIKIIDFGIATVFSRENPTLKNPNVLEGTLAYISPEQTGRMNRALDYRTDFYSLGVTFYELLTGQLPFTSTDALELVHCHIAKQPVSPDEINSEIPKAVANIVMKLMAKTAEERYQSAFGIKADLEQCLNQLQRHGEISEFLLGTQDISDKFQISQKLYGREAEITTLLAAFERVAGTAASTPDNFVEKQETSPQKLSSDKSSISNIQSKNKATASRSAIEMMLVAGYSGIGKSALVQEIYKPITRSRGYFISGKFDQFQRNIPYSAVVRAFQGLVRQLLTETEVQLAQWQEKISTALGVNGQVIINVIPEVELIVGKQSAVSELGATESQNRFNLVFQNFIRVFCTPEHPLVIFLDDLQWADSATLNLLELIMTDIETEYLFLIGAYRDNEVSPTHSLMITLERLRKAGAIINQITLSPLAIHHVSELIAESLHSDTETVKRLGKLVVKKTNGNPFFVNEFLKFLYQERRLNFDFQYRCWQWNINQIESANITDNVVDLIINKLNKLPLLTQHILHLSACIGAEFDLNTLSIICEQPAVEIFSSLKVAIQSGLILPLSELDSQLLIQNYQFGHDRIQQAAYVLIDQAQKKAVHLQIGRLLLQNCAGEVLSEQIFEIVDHLNIGVELVTEQQERDQIAKLNLMAGKRAKAATAYTAAVKYLKMGLDLLAEESWRSQYELTLNLHEEAVEAEYLSTNYEQAEKLAEVVLEQAENQLDKVKAYELKIHIYKAKNQLINAIEIGLEAVALLGISLSTGEESAIELPALVDLENFPEMTNAEQLAAMRVLMSIIPAAYYAKPKIVKLIALTMVNLTIQQGYSFLSAYGYIWYAGISAAQGNIETAYHSGQLALILVNKYHAKELKVKVHHLFCFIVRHWKEPSKNNIVMLQEAIQSGLDTGDNEYASYCIKEYCIQLFIIAEPLELVESKMAQSFDLLLKLKQEYSIHQANIWRQVCLNLLRQSPTPSRLLGESFNEDKIIPRLVAVNNRTLLCVIYLAKLHLSYLFKDYDQAVANAILTAEYIESVMGAIYVAIHNFYYSLALLAHYSHEQPESLRQVELNQQQMQKWADLAPSNFKHKYELVEAEKARILGQNWQAAEFYEQAIKGAKDNGYIQEEALAYELAAEFYLACGMDKIAQTYLKEAHYSYTLWQAWAKVKDLEVRYPQLVTTLSVATSLTNTRKNTIGITTSTSSGTALDLATVIKASQSIGSEIVLEQLLRNLMKILIENAGAQVGYLILKNNGQLLIEAEGVVDGDEVTVLQSISIDNRLPISIINYVTRSFESVVLNDASAEGNFTHDPYIQQHLIKSILCVPLINQGKLVSIVYLENNLTTGAFTPDRLEVLKILSSQAAISIENARLYQTLEDKVKERTSQLEAANQEITTLNELLKEENFRMSAELEVTKQLQQMVLPKQSELDAIVGLEIAGFMEPADEVGGDYYDVLQQDGRVKIGIGDVTGHGLESGVLMLMTQTAVRTLQESNQTDPVKFLDTLNRTIYGNVQRINPYKNLTLSLLDYADGVLSFSGQHEEIIVVRAGGKLELIDTKYLGFPIGLEDDISDFIASEQIQLNPGDIVVLYTDGITEAFDINREEYGLERLCEVISHNWELSAEGIKQAVIDDLRRHIGEQKVFDDITLVVLKQK